MDSTSPFKKMIMQFKVKYGEDLNQNSGSGNKRRNYLKNDFISERISGVAFYTEGEGVVCVGED